MAWTELGSLVPRSLLPTTETGWGSWAQGQNVCMWPQGQPGPRWLHGGKKAGGRGKSGWESTALSLEMRRAGSCPGGPVR